MMKIFERLMWLYMLAFTFYFGIALNPIFGGSGDSFIVSLLKGVAAGIFILMVAGYFKNLK